MWRFTESQFDFCDCGYFTPKPTPPELIGRAVLTLPWDKAHSVASEEFKPGQLKPERS